MAVVQAYPTHESERRQTKRNGKRNEGIRSYPGKLLSPTSHPAAALPRPAAIFPPPIRRTASHVPASRGSRSTARPPIWPRVDRSGGRAGDRDNRIAARRRAVAVATETDSQRDTERGRRRKRAEGWPAEGTETGDRRRERERKREERERAVGIQIIRVVARRTESAEPSARARQPFSLSFSFSTFEKYQAFL